METEKVLFFTKEYYMFSNFSAFAVEWNDKLWPTSEHAYQAAKFEDDELQEEIRNASSPKAAYDLAHEHESKMDPDWDKWKLGIMEEIVRAKLEQHPYIQKKLLETGDREIVEDSPTDSFWGWGPDKMGENHLGKIWMTLRDELNVKAG